MIPTREDGVHLAIKDRADATCPHCLAGEHR